MKTVQTFNFAEFQYKFLQSNKIDFTTKFFHDNKKIPIKSGKFFDNKKIYFEALRIKIIPQINPIIFGIQTAMSGSKTSPRANAFDKVMIE